MSGKLIHNLKRQRAQSAAPAEPLNLVLAATVNEPLLAKVQTAPPSVVAVVADDLPVDNPAKRIRTAPTPMTAVAPSDFLKAALQKVLDLQADLARIDQAALDGSDEQRNIDGVADDDDDSGNEEEDAAFLGLEAEALGFAICARETLTFLAAAGVPRDGELVQRLRSNLVGKCAGLPI